ncbi:hypothetical protein ScalyP_jg6632 [Parmales sp. scaly parma]|nr:hypothetical protein ScalyP_jg6632 [Parmales sp. scaly parma]
MVATPLKALAPTAKTNQLLLLLSEGVSDPIQEGACRRAKSLMEAHNVDAIVVDGMDPEQKDRRNELFAISQIRGKYPQFFVVTEHKESETHNAGFVTEFLGDWEKIEALNECNSLDKEVLDANPDIETFTMLLDIVKLKSD